MYQLIYGFLSSYHPQHFVNLTQNLISTHQIDPTNKYHIGESMTEVLANMFNVSNVV